jgi:hypothetical protein
MEADAPIDPEVEFFALLPGGGPDAADLEKHVLGSIASLEEARGGGELSPGLLLRREFFADYGPFLEGAAILRPVVTPRVGLVTPGHALRVRIDFEIERPGRTMFALAARIHGAEGVTLSVSDLQPLVVGGRSVRVVEAWSRRIWR